MAATLRMMEPLQSQVKITRVLSQPIFLFYSWKRGDYADIVEAILRRQEKFLVFRDE
jgi:hypothetical protein